jgi:hypothetical protein
MLQTLIFGQFFRSDFAATIMPFLKKMPFWPNWSIFQVWLRRNNYAFFWKNSFLTETAPGWNTKYTIKQSTSCTRILQSPVCLLFWQTPVVGKKYNQWHKWYTEKYLLGIMNSWLHVIASCLAPKHLRTKYYNILWPLSLVSQDILTVISCVAAWEKQSHGQNLRYWVIYIKRKLIN